MGKPFWFRAKLSVLIKLVGLSANQHVKYAVPTGYQFGGVGPPQSQEQPGYGAGRVLNSSLAEERVYSSVSASGVLMWRVEIKS